MLLMLVLPASEAAPRGPTPYCGGGKEVNTYAMGSLGYEMSAGCHTTVYAFRGITCVGAWTGQKEVTVGGTTVEVNYCTGGPDPTMPGCPKKDYSLRAGITASVAHNCSVTITVDVQDCLWNEAWHEVTVSRATVRMSYCEGPPSS